MQIHFVQPNGERQTAQLAADESVMTCAKREMVPGIIGECGGAMMCGTCHVYVEEQCLDLLPQPTEQERDLLSGCIEPQENSRLGCQLRAVDGLDELTLFVPENQT